MATRQQRTTRNRGTRRPAGKAAAGAKGTRKRKASPAQAPGKRRLAPPPSARGVKKSDLKIPKLRAAEAMRYQRKSHVSSLTARGKG